MCGGPIRVFLCDDLPESRTLVRYGLEENGEFEIVGEAEEPISGIPMIERLEPDAVVLDVSMPGMGGLDAIDAIRDADPDAAVVVYSGFLDRGSAAADDGAAADAYVGKGAPMTALAEAIVEAVQSRRARGGEGSRG